MGSAGCGCCVASAFVGSVGCVVSASVGSVVVLLLVLLVLLLLLLLLLLAVSDVGKGGYRTGPSPGASVAPPCLPGDTSSVAWWSSGLASDVPGTAGTARPKRSRKRRGPRTGRRA